MANLDVLLYISKRGGSAVLCTEDTKVFVVRCGRIVLTELKGATVSVFPFDGSSCNLTYEGLQYPLEKKDLSAGSSLMGVSNCIISDRAEIRVNIGCALVIVYTPKDMPAEPPQSEDSKPPARNGRQKRYRKIIRNQMMHLRIYWNDPVRELR